MIIKTVDSETQEVLADKVKKPEFSSDLGPALKDEGFFEGTSSPGGFEVEPTVENVEAVDQSCQATADHQIITDTTKVHQVMPGACSVFKVQAPSSGSALESVPLLSRDKVNRSIEYLCNTRSRVADVE